MRPRLTAEELALARNLWRDLKEGASNAHEQLNQAPANVRMAILNALVISMELRFTENKPFG